MVNRRTISGTLAAALLGRKLPGQAAIPMRALTKGPGFHWFGYYDKLQFDPSSRLVLGMHVNFEGR